MLAEGEYNPSQGTSSKNDEKDQNHYVPPEMEPPVFSIGSIHHSQHAEVKLGPFEFALILIVDRPLEKQETPDAGAGGDMTARRQSHATRSAPPARTDENARAHETFSLPEHWYLNAIFHVPELCF